MWVRAIFALLLLYTSTMAKEDAVYQLKGVELLDLLRGFTPKDNKVELVKVEGDRAGLPDGVYFEPEDDALAPGEQKYLHLNSQSKKTGLVEKQDGVTTGN